MLWMPAGASQLRDSLSLSGARSNRSNKGAIRRHLRPQSGSTSGASSRWEEAGRGAEGQAGAHIRDELAIETGLSGRRRRPPVRPAPCAPSADEFRRGCSAYRHSGQPCELAELPSSCRHAVVSSLVPYISKPMPVRCCLPSAKIARRSGRPAGAALVTIVPTRK